jgi:hypothetical protein
VTADENLRKALFTACFAFNKDGLRCMEPAGHDGPHSHAIEWSDDEVWTPTAGLPIPQPPLWPPAPPATQGSGICMICEHPHHPNGVCGADDGGYDCDCANSVEE